MISRDQNIEVFGFLKLFQISIAVITSPTKCAHLPLQVTAPSGYISNYVATDSGCGSIDSPWQIVVKPGQTINITLFDFFPSDDAIGDMRETCMVLVVIKEGGLGTDKQRSETICRRGQRVMNVYRSLSNEVEVRIVAKWDENHPGGFLLHYAGRIICF